MRSSAILLVALGALAGCADTHTRVDVTVRNGSLDATTLGAIHRLAVAVTGAETFTTTYDLTDELTHGGARWVYLAGVDSGELVFSVTALDASGAAVAAGSSGLVPLHDGNAAHALVALGPPSRAVDGGGADGSPGDAGPPADAGSDGGVDFAWPSFVPAVLYPVGVDEPLPIGAKPTAIAIGDLNHDGHNDVAFVNNPATSDQLVRAYYTAPFSYTKISSNFGGFGNVSSLSLFDIDGDLDLDVGMTDATANLVFWVASKNNNYASTTNTSISGASTLVLADVNHDLNFDIVVVQPSQSQVDLYLNQGSGVFNPNPPTAIGTAPDALAMTDLNNDGYPDFVSTSGGASGGLTLMQWAPALNTFGMDTISVGPPTGVAAGNLNGDAFPDLVVTRTDGSVGILINDLSGSSSLTPMPPLTAGNGALSPAIGDLDGDGINDIAVANHDDMTVSLFIGKGDGTFAAAVTISVEVAPITGPSSPNQLVIGDLDGDKRQDLAIAADAGVYLFLTHR